MMLGGLEGEGDDAAEQGGIEVEWDDATQREDEERETAAQGLRQSSRQRGADTEEGGSSGGVSVECQAWKETTLMARGEMVVPRLRSRQRATQEQTSEEVQLMATVVGAEEGGRMHGKRALDKGRHRASGGLAGKKKTAMGKPQGGVRSDRGQGVMATGEPGAGTHGGTKARRGAKRQHAKKEGRGAKHHTEVPDGAGARLEQQAGGHEWHGWVRM